MRTNLRWPGISVLIGGVLLAVSTVLHPVAVDPFHSKMVIAHIAKSHNEWMFDHALMALSIVLWLIGLSECSGRIVSNGTVSGLFTASLAMWLIVLSFELGGMPLAVRRLQAHADPALQTWIDSMFASSLIAGYMAMVPAWLAVLLGAWTIRKTPPMHGWLPVLGVIGGAIGLIGIVYTVIFPSVWVLLVTTVGPYGWTLLFGWRCFRTTNR